MKDSFLFYDLSIKAVLKNVSHFPLSYKISDNVWILTIYN